MANDNKPLVAVIMGSDSDLPTMRESAAVLEKFGVPYAMRVTSAHRSPKTTHALVEALEADGVQVFVVGAGLAAHLAGAIASISIVPVIGVPMEGGSLQGVDALYSTVQMPSGVPVATMSIGKNGAKNAAILAVEILALQDSELARKLREHKEELERSVTEKDKAVASEFDKAAQAIQELTEGGLTEEDKS
jgi:5-(carboxyamino)imidazole ribonucleotide mutase